MHLWWSLCTLYLLVPGGVTEGDSGLCCVPCLLKGFSKTRLNEPHRQTLKNLFPGQGWMKLSRHILSFEKGTLTAERTFISVSTAPHRGKGWTELRIFFLTFLLPPPPSFNCFLSLSLFSVSISLLFRFILSVRKILCVRLLPWLFYRINFQRLLYKIKRNKQFLKTIFFSQINTKQYANFRHRRLRSGDEQKVRTMKTMTR